MELLNKVTKKLKTKSTIVTDAVPSYPDRNGDVPESRIPPVNIEEVSEEESSTNHENSNSNHEDLSSNRRESIPIVTEPSDDAPPVPPRRKKSKAKPQPSCSKDSDPDDKEIPQTPPINTQASGSVINIVNSTGVHVGATNTYHLGSPSKNGADASDDDPEAHVPKTKSVDAVMKSDEKVSFEYMDILSRNIGIGWRRVFRRLGYTDPALDTYYESHHHKGLPEVIYQILLDWVRTGQRTLGELCTATWKEGKRLAVSEVAKLYKQNKKNDDL